MRPLGHHTLAPDMFLDIVMPIPIVPMTIGRTSTIHFSHEKHKFCLSHIVGKGDFHIGSHIAFTSHSVGQKKILVEKVIFFYNAVLLIML